MDANAHRAAASGPGAELERLAWRNDTHAAYAGAQPHVGAAAAEFNVLDAPAAAREAKQARVRPAKRTAGKPNRRPTPKRAKRRR